MAKRQDSGSSSAHQNERKIYDEDGIPETTEDMRNVADESDEDEFEDTDDVDDTDEEDEESIA